MKDIVGFGRESAGKPTTTSNAFVRVTTEPVADGAIVTVECQNGMCLPDGSKSTQIDIVRDKLPRPGQRVMVGKRLVKVSKVDRIGRRILDEDTKEWIPWQW